MSQQKLYDALLAVSAEKKTGNIYITGKESKFCRSGTIMVKDGNIVGMRYMNRTGNEAMIGLMAMVVNETLFIAAGTVNDEKIPGTPDIALVLQQLQQGHTHPELDNHLQQDAQRLLKALYGNNVVKKVETIASKTPPDSNPVAFLDKCKALIEPMFGKRKADQMFAALYEKVR